METIYLKLEKILFNLLEDEQKSIYFDDVNEMDIANEIYEGMINKIFSLSSDYFVIPFLKSIRQSKPIDAFESFLLEREHIISELCTEIEEFGEWHTPISDSIEHQKTFECYRLYNYLFKQVFKVGELFDIDVNDFYPHKILLNQTLSGETYIRLSDAAVSGNTYLSQKFERSLTHKQQVVLMAELGFFELPTISKLNDLQKGNLFGHLLNRSVDNTENYIRYRNSKIKGQIQDSFFIYDSKNIARINEILIEVGITIK